MPCHTNERCPMCGFVGFTGDVENKEQVLTSMMDRIVHHGRPVTYDRESHRVKHALMRGEL